MSEHGPTEADPGGGDDGGRRNAKGRQRPERAHGDRERSAQRPSERNRSSDPQRLAAYTVLRAVADGAYANLELPEGVARQGDPRPGRRLHHRARLRRGADARALRPDHQRGRRTPAGQDRPQRPGHAAARRPPAAGDAGADPRRRGRDGRAWPARSTAPARRGSSTPSCAGSASATWTHGSPRSCRPATLTARLAVEHSHPEWIVKAMRAALLGHGAATRRDRRRRADRPGDRRQRPPRRSPSWPGPAWPTVAELVDAGAGASPLSRVGAVLDGGDPGGIPAVREGRAAVQDEGSQLVALALAAVPVDGATEPSSGSTCARVRGARPGCSRAWPSRRAPTSPPTR